MPSRGVRNNNLGNIRRTVTRWIGLKSEQTDKDFYQFETLGYGCRAFFIICRTYRHKYGIHNTKAFIRRYAPPSENNTNGYINYIMSNVGYDLSSDDDYVRLAQYVFLYESCQTCTKSYLHEVLRVFKIKIV